MNWILYDNSSIDSSDFWLDRLVGLGGLDERLRALTMAPKFRDLDGHGFQRNEANDSSSGRRVDYLNPIHFNLPPSQKSHWLRPFV
jgi:hypothetical protein